jgi:hypothetical protein
MKTTIIEAIKEVMETNGEPMTVIDIHDQIAVTVP